MEGRFHAPVPADAAVQAASMHATDSGRREKIIEHLFVGDLLRCLWRKGIRDVDVLRAEVDRNGYDLVLEANGVVRHIQLKASHRLAKTAKLDIQVNLARKPSACVIWIRFDADTLNLGPYLWFGAEPGLPLLPFGNMMSRHAKADSQGHKGERINHRVLKTARFKKLPTIEAIAEHLFG
jgi:hypothetical protein